MLGTWLTRSRGVLPPHPVAILKSNRNSTYKIWEKRIRLGQSLTPINSNWREDKFGRFIWVGLIRMIIQKSFESHHVIAITQTAHAWVSGQLARQWGNKSFSSFAPVEPLCYAAEQHDRGFLDWERQPMLNPRSGLPHTFENIPLKLDVELRKKSILELKAVSLYAALVTSLYFARTVGKQGSLESHDDRLRIAEFLREQEALQRIEYNQGLLSAWDQLSVQLFRDPDCNFSINNVPYALDKTCRLSVTSIDPSCREVGLEPWPFSKPRVELTCEGHVLDRRFTSEADLRRYLKDARRVSVIYTLIPSTQASMS
jgi:hypothetical protein